MPESDSRSESTAARSPTAQRAALRPALGGFTASTIVIGGMIGSGIFLKPSEVARHTDGFMGLAISLWIVCGVINLCGALAQAELAAMFPHAGGTYVFLREAFGRTCAVAFAWAEFWVIRTGAIAALAVSLTLSLRPLLAGANITFDDGDWRWIEKLAAVGAIGLLAIINVAGVVWGGAMQNATTFVKVAFIAVLAILPLIVWREGAAQSVPVWPTTMGDASLWTGIGAALGAIMWAYDGWGNLTVVAEEVRTPERTIPMALIGGVLAVVALYAGANLAFHLALPPEELKHTFMPGATILGRVVGDAGERWMLVMLIISVFGALNQIILTGPRVLLAAGRDVPRLAIFGHVDPRTATPAIAILAQASWAAALVLIGDVGISDAALANHRRLFDVLTDYCIFGGSVFYLLATAAVFVLRWRRPDAARPFHTPGYPYVPAVFVAFYMALLAAMLVATPRESIAGLLFVVVGFAAARWFSRD